LCITERKNFSINDNLSQSLQPSPRLSYQKKSFLLKEMSKQAGEEKKTCFDKKVLTAGLPDCIFSDQKSQFG
jgi:hypothetical protein